MSDKKYNCIVVDDEFLSRKLLSDHISKVPELNLVGSYESPLEAMSDLSSKDVRVIFTDIDMPNISGIEFVENLSFKPFIIFVTAYSEYAAKAFEIDAIEYLLKPVTFPRFIKAANKVITILNFHEKAIRMTTNAMEDQNLVETEHKKRSMLIKTDRKHIQVAYDDIFFIEGALEYVNFQTEDKKIMGLYSLKKLEEELPSNQFMRIHKSYIVNIDKIKMVDGNQVILNNWRIPVSKKYKTELLDRIEEK
jgi:DNA-binding LytR/AlgR family response regulator